MKTQKSARPCKNRPYMYQRFLTNMALKDNKSAQDLFDRLDAALLKDCTGKNNVVKIKGRKAMGRLDEGCLGLLVKDQDIQARRNVFRLARDTPIPKDIRMCSCADLLGTNAVDLLILRNFGMASLRGYWEFAQKHGRLTPDQCPPSWKKQFVEARDYFNKTALDRMSKARVNIAFWLETFPEDDSKFLAMRKAVEKYNLATARMIEFLQAKQ